MAADQRISAFSHCSASRQERRSWLIQVSISANAGT